MEACFLTIYMRFYELNARSFANVFIYLFAFFLCSSYKKLEGGRMEDVKVEHIVKYGQVKKRLLEFFESATVMNL